jgi:protein SCO1/2
MKGSPFENPYVLATQIGSWLHNWKLPPRSGQDYASAPPVRNISKGEELFRTRCSSCHTIGAEEEAAQSGRHAIGPDLLGVTRSRERAWLLRFIAEPDKMLAEKDPLAMALKAEYKNVTMPNLRLGEQDIRNLITYMEEETARVEQRRSKVGEQHQ